MKTLRELKADYLATHWADAGHDVQRHLNGFLAHVEAARAASDGAGAEAKVYSGGVEVTELEPLSDEAPAAAPEAGKPQSGAQAPQPNLTTGSQRKMRAAGGPGEGTPVP
jgi:hypothetical protein